MATTKIRLAELALKHLTDDLTEEESIEISQLLQDPVNQKLFEKLTDHARIEEDVKGMWRAEANADTSWQKIEAAYRFDMGHTEAAYHFPHKSIPWKKYLRAAAVVLPLAGLAGWYFYQKLASQTSTEEAVPATVQYASVTPRSQRAVWTRNAGLAIYLDSYKNGVIGYSDGGPVTKNDSELVYPAARRSDIPLPDTVQTLRGGYYQVRLPDGSRVVLNSASTVLFAPVFGNNNRQVSVNGEAWFDVVKDSTRPFTVHAPGLKIEVFGTKFTVQAYKEDNIVRTTLLDGSVKVTAGKQSLSLKPGEQAVLTKKKKLEKVTDSSAVKKATAWKSGKFIFENDDVRSIMKQLSRNYNLDVVYKGELPNKTFDGSFYHKDDIRTILETLHERTGIKFTIVGNIIIVKP